MITIIGAGVSGLTCGIVLRERGYDVQVLAETETMQTTSAVAAAIWFPYHAGDGVDAWARTSYHRFQSFVAERGSGVSMIDFRVFSRNDIMLPHWEVPRPQRLPAEELMPPYRSGYVVNVPVMETPIYLPYLMRRLGTDRIHTGRKINHVTDLDCEVIVNCAGLYGPDFSHNDPSSMRPGRGVVVRGKSSLKYAFLDADGERDGQLTYLVPRRQHGDCVLGGSDNPQSNWSLVPMDDEASAILDRCRKIDPDLQTGEPCVGLRPLRAKGVRLESEKVDDRTVIHNYGHGGAGLTLSWGCAEDVADLVAKTL
jgi:D-amino-acid oxidase